MGIAWAVLAVDRGHAQQVDAAAVGVEDAEAEIVDHRFLVALVWASFDDREDEALRPHAHSFEDVCPVWAKMPSMTTGE